jgi:hypothetical protein
MLSLKTFAVLTAILVGRAPAGVERFEALDLAVQTLAVSQIKITAADALAVALESAEEAELIGFELGLDGVKPVFEFVLLSTYGVEKLAIDGAHGELLARWMESSSTKEKAHAAQLLETLGAASTLLTDAVAAARREAMKKGKKARDFDRSLVSARVRLEDGVLRFTLGLLGAPKGKLQQIVLDASGKVTKAGPKRAAGDAWTFEHAAADKPPARWQLEFTHPDGARATWSVASDRWAPSGAKVLTLKTSSAGSVFNLAIATGTSYQDVSVRASLRPESGREDQGGGVMWRCRNADNYYFCRFNPLESNYRIYKVVDGRRIQLGSATVETETDTWYVVRAEMVGDHITCFLDGEKYLDVRDETFEDAGQIGLWTKADASSSFDNVAVKSVPPQKRKGEDKKDKQDD